MDMSNYVLDDEAEDAPIPLDNGEASVEGMEDYVEVEPVAEARIFRHRKGFLVNIKGQKCDRIGRLTHGRGCKGAGSRKWGEPRRTATVSRLASVPEQVFLIVWGWVISYCVGPSF